MNLRVSELNNYLIVSQNSKGKPNAITCKNNFIEFPRSQYPGQNLTLPQKQYEDAKNKMLEIEIKYEPSRDPNLMVYWLTPFNPVVITDETDKKEYFAAKQLVDKVSDAQKKKLEIEVKYEPSRAPELFVYHPYPFDTSQCMPEDREVYEEALAIIYRYIPKSEMQNVPTPYIYCEY